MRTCKVCTSNHRDEIDELIRNGWELKEIYRTIKGRYPTEKTPSYKSICYHARYHVRQLTSLTTELQKRRQQIIEQEMKASVQAVTQLKTNLQIVSDLLQKAMQEGIDEPKKREEIGMLIWRANQTIEMLLKYQQQIEHKDVSEDVILQKLLFCLSDVDPATVEKVIQRWNMFGTH